MSNTSEKGRSLVEKLAERFGIADGNKLFEALKQTAFSNGNKQPTEAQMMALLVVADQHGLNPWTKEIYAFPDKKGGIVPVVGVDGWSRIANEHPEFDGVEFSMSDNLILMDEKTKPCPEYMECTVHRKDRTHSFTVREYLDEVYRPPVEKQGNRGAYTVTGPWQTHPKRFLRHKTMIQAFRLAFGFAGIYDSDEASRIREQQERDMGTAEVVDTPMPTPISVQQQTAMIEHQQSDLMGQVVKEQIIDQPSDEPVTIEQSQYQVIEQQTFNPNQMLVDLTNNLINSARANGAWDTCLDYARQTWQGSDQAYVLNQLEKARQTSH